MKALFSVRGKDGRIAAMLCTHVDDLLWAATEEATPWVQKLLDTFDVRKVETDDFRFCGKEIKQDKQGNIKVSCQDTTEKIQPIRFDKGKRRMTERATDSEKEQMRSVVGSLAWVGRQCRPDVSYEVSRGQSAQKLQP